MGTRGRKPSRETARTSPVKGKKTPPGTRMDDFPAPADISASGAELWDELVPSLARMGALMASDRPLLAEMVESVALARDYRKALRKAWDAGDVTEIDRNGKEYTTPFPGSKTEQRLRAGYVQSMSTAEKLAAEFGLTPTSRMRLGLMQAAGHKTLGEILNEGDE